MQSYDFAVDYRLIFTLGTIIVIFVLYLILTRLITWFIKKNEFVILDDLSSGIKFFTRIIAGYLIIASVSFFYKSTELILLLTALVGTIITLSSLQVINNFMAGIVIILMQPYRAEDFINLGGYEGRVATISLNYTKILTINDVFVLIPNRYALTADLTNYSIEQASKKDERNYLSDAKELLIPFGEKKVTRYSFSIAIPLENLAGTIDKVKSFCGNNLSIFGYEPTFFLINIGWKAEYQFILKSASSEIIRTNLKPFRNQLLKTIYPKPEN